MSKKKACALMIILGVPYFFGIGLVAGHDSLGGYPVARAFLFAITATIISAGGMLLLMYDSDSIA